MFLRIAVVASIVAVANAAHLPPFITACSRRSSNLNACISNNVEAAKPYLVNGSPELSIPSLKNIIIPYSVVNRPYFQFGVWNYNITGLENFNVLKVDADLKKNLFKFQIEFPYAEAVGQYGSKGNLFNLNFDSTGLITAYGRKLIMNFELKTKIIQRHGYSYFEQVYRHVDLSINGIFHMTLHNLYLGNTEITRIMNRIVNENSYYMFEVVVPILENHLDGLLEKAIDHFFKTYTYDELLP